jgi:peptide/nickel transport system substrate-binding protein
MHEAAAIIIQAALKDIGINVTIDKLNPTVFAKSWTTGNLQMYLRDWGGSIYDGAYLLSLYYTTGSFFNIMKYSNTEADKLMAQANEITDENTRLNLFKSIQKKIWDDAAVVWIVQPDYTLAMRSNISGYTNPLSDLQIRYKYFTKK